MLIEAGADFDNTDLGLTLERRNLIVARALLEAGVTLKKEPVILKAVKWGDHSLVRDLIAAGADVNELGDLEVGALIEAVYEEDEELIEILLEAGADINRCYYKEEQRSYITALSAAMSEDNVEMVRVLLKYGASPHDSEALYYAVVSYRQVGVMVGTLLSEFDKRFPQGNRWYGPAALKVAICEGNFPLMKDLKQRTAVNSFCNDTDRRYSWQKWFDPLQDVGSTLPLAVAIQKDYGTSLKETQWLLESGADPNSIVSTSPRRTALSMAVFTKSVKMVELLLKHGADINQPATKGIERTALQQAAEVGSFEIAQMLSDLGADINAAPARSEGGTALQLTARKGYLGIVLLLLKVGTDINAPPAKANGRTALEGAAEWG